MAQREPFTGNLDATDAERWGFADTCLSSGLGHKQIATHECHVEGGSECTNTNGSYACGDCFPGFIRINGNSLGNGDPLQRGTICQDIDEC